MKKTTLIIAWILLGALSLPVCAASLDIETEYRFRGLSYNNPDFNQFIRDNTAFYENRLRLSIKGSPIENIQIISRIQALGLAGGTTNYTLVGGTNTIRYPDTGFQPWVENIYIKLDNVNNMPLTLQIGKQPFLYGSGFIFADDELGFNAIKAIWHFSDQFKLETFTAKINESRFGEDDLDAYGLAAVSKTSHSEWLLGIFSEKDRTGNPVIGSQEIYNIPTAAVDKYFLEYYLKKILQGAYYSINIALQRGDITYTDSTMPNQKYQGSNDFKVDKLFDYLEPLGFVFEGGLKSYGNTFTGPIEVHTAWGLGTGDDQGSVIENEAFSPSFGHQYDGLERTGFGEFYSATLYDAYPALPIGYSGIQIINLGGFISPYAQLKIGIDYYIFDAQQAAPGGAKELGREFDLTFRYPYSNYISLDASYAMFFPKDGLGKDSAKAERFMLGIVGRF
ncbi:MAG: hypothetical protein ABII23_00620 [bacterium]